VRQGKRLGAGVDNNKIISEPVHFGEGDMGIRIHWLYIGLIRGLC
jgi:hypothetical protein